MKTEKITIDIEKEFNLKSATDDKKFIELTKFLKKNNIEYSTWSIKNKFTK